MRKASTPFDQTRFRRELIKLDMSDLLQSRLIEKVLVLRTQPQQDFPDGFYDVKQAIEDIESQKSIGRTEAIQNLANDVSILYARCDMETAPTSKTAYEIATLSPMTRLSLRQRSVVGSKFSRETIEHLSIPEISKTGLSGNRKLREELDLEEGNTPSIFDEPSAEPDARRRGESTLARTVGDWHKKSSPEPL